jgi:hypothetical protein
MGKSFHYKNIEYQIFNEEVVDKKRGFQKKN